MAAGRPKPTAPHWLTQYKRRRRPQKLELWSIQSASAIATSPSGMFLTGLSITTWTLAAV